MQNLRTVFSQVYHGGRSMGSRSFSSPPGCTCTCTCSNESNGVSLFLVRGISVAVGFFIGMERDESWKVVQVIKMLDRSAEEFQLREKLYLERLSKATRDRSAG